MVHKSRRLRSVRNQEAAGGAYVAFHAMYAICWVAILTYNTSGIIMAETISILSPPVRSPELVCNSAVGVLRILEKPRTSTAEVRAACLVQAGSTFYDCLGSCNLESASDGSVQMEFLVTSAKTDQQLCVASVTFHMHYLPGSKAWMIDVGSNVKDLRHRTD